MSNFLFMLHTIQLAAAMIFSVYLMMTGMGDYLDGLIELSRGKMIIGLITAVLTLIYAKTHLIVESEAVKPLLFPVLYFAFFLGLNALLGSPFEIAL